MVKAERYFNFYYLTKEKKMEAVVIGLESDALSWYNWEHRLRPIRFKTGYEFGYAER